MKTSGSFALSEEQTDAFLREAKIIRLATHGLNGRINLAPLWFCWTGERLYAFTRGQKIRNLRRNPQCTVMLDRNESYPELQGVMLEGTARVLEDAAAEAADEQLDAVVREVMGAKYSMGGFGSAGSTRNNSSAMGDDWRWIVFTPDRGFSWDNTRLPPPRVKP